MSFETALNIVFIGTLCTGLLAMTVIVFWWRSMQRDWKDTRQRSIDEFKERNNWGE